MERVYGDRLEQCWACGAYHADDPMEECHACMAPKDKRKWMTEQRWSYRACLVVIVGGSLLVWGLLWWVLS